jgi:hypothetical protein
MAAAEVRSRLEADGSFDRIEAGLKAINVAFAHRSPGKRDAERAAFLSRQLDLAVARFSSLPSPMSGQMFNGLTSPRSTLLLQQQREQHQQNRVVAAAATRQHHDRQRQLLMNDDDATEDEENVGMAMTEPTPECRRILNTWTSKCVFTDAMAK